MRPINVRQTLGASVLDVPRYLRLLWLSDVRSKYAAPWIEIRNRNETLSRSIDGPGVSCDWEWTSDLHGARVFPSLGRLLLRRALRDWPIRFEPRIHSTGKPRVSFILGHRGPERILLLLTTLQSLFGQEGPECEFLVVEQDDQPRIAGWLPSEVRYIYSKSPVEGMPYSRSWAFNVGAREAEGEMLIFHDNDTCAPAGYAAEVIRLFDLGYDALRLQRFIFYLSQESSKFVIEARRVPDRPLLDAITQNCEGATMAVSRESFFAIGGFDESFVGWGGEDNEFFERCLTLKHYMRMYLPFIHLHHEPQGEKGSAKGGPTARLLSNRSEISAVDRIAELRKRDFGQLGHLDPPYRPANQHAEKLA